ncbi:vegetative cell wall protein gp1-like [Helianthus annuus]|uniref:vegetative cell wall protein gp1-like n=1 Tax=Helianthus annuus TaxID=4232 RepID=UPI000B8FB3F7|nr:vegetative cell wall protein gp1-like [Helianthus annuus]
METDPEEDPQMPLLPQGYSPDESGYCCAIYPPRPPTRRVGEASSAYRSPSHHLTSSSEHSRTPDVVIPVGPFPRSPTPATGHWEWEPVAPRLPSPETPPDPYTPSTPSTYTPSSPSSQEEPLVRFRQAARRRVPVPGPIFTSPISPVHLTPTPIGTQQHFTAHFLTPPREDPYLYHTYEHGGPSQPFREPSPPVWGRPVPSQEVPAPITESSLMGFLFEQILLLRMARDEDGQQRRTMGDYLSVLQQAIIALQHGMGYVQHEQGHFRALVYGCVGAMVGLVAGFAGLTCWMWRS